MCIGTRESCEKETNELKRTKENAPEVKNCNKSNCLSFSFVNGDIYSHRKGTATQK